MQSWRSVLKPTDFKGNVENVICYRPPAKSETRLFFTFVFSLDLRTLLASLARDVRMAGNCPSRQCMPNLIGGVLPLHQKLLGEQLLPLAPPLPPPLLYYISAFIRTLQTQLLIEQNQLTYVSEHHFEVLKVRVGVTHNRVPAPLLTSALRIYSSCTKAHTYCSAYRQREVIG